jgi:hypothetical protein
LKVTGITAAAVAMAATMAAAMPTSAGSLTKSYNALTGDSTLSLSSCTADTWQAPAPNINAVCFTVIPGEKTHITIHDDHSANVAGSIQITDVAGATGATLFTVNFCNEIDVTPPDKAGVMYVYMSASGMQTASTGPMGAPVPTLPCGPGAGNATTGTVTADGASQGNMASASASTTRRSAHTQAPAAMVPTIGSATEQATRFSRSARPL